MSQVLNSPAPIQSICQSKQRRKRRPTRTPKPSTQSVSAISRLCSPSPFLDRSFQRKKLYFGDHSNQHNDIDHDESTGSDSEYFPDPESLQFDPDDSSTEYHDYDQYEHKKQSQPQPQRGGTTDEIITDIQNLSIHANKTKSRLLRNVRASVRSNNNNENVNINTPKLFETKQIAKIKKKKKKNEISDNKIKKALQPKITTVRITKSQRVFKKCHSFGKLLVKPLECGSGCPLYCSRWKDELSVTKLMPLFENQEFSKEENIENALREFEFHAEIYRKGSKLYGVNESPTVAIYACVKLKHDGECTKLDPTPKEYLTFVMPQLHCNLAQFVSKYRKLTKDEGYKLLVTGLRFLDLLKSANMVHCDIKPENIFLDVLEDRGGKVMIDKFVFGDFGCAAVTTEEFPYGNLTGTITMWDIEALGKKYGDENGFDARNDLYGFIVSLLDGMYGGSMIEELLEEEDENWEDTEWSDYTELIRKCRKRMMNVEFMEHELNEMKCKDGILRTVLMQIGKTRKERMTLQQLLLLVDIR